VVQDSVISDMCMFSDHSAARCKEGIGEDEGADGVASAICTVGVEFDDS
jgi:hypothetical protein